MRCYTQLVLKNTTSQIINQSNNYQLTYIIVQLVITRYCRNYDGELF